MLAINDINGLAHIYGMHEGSGPVHYKRLVNGGMLDMQIAGFDYASLPPGSVIGMHSHMDNSEIWIVLSGLGHVQYEDTPVLMRPSQVLYTPNGGRHSMTNPPDAAAPIEFVVVTMNSPTVAPNTVTSSEVRPLDHGPTVFTGLGKDIYTVSITGLDPGGVTEVHTDTAQHLAFLVDGDAQLSWGSVSSDLKRGAALGIPSSEHITLTAGPAAACRILLVRIDHEAFVPGAQS